MAKEDSLSDFLEDIGDAIKEVGHIEGEINAQDFSNKIRTLSTSDIKDIVIDGKSIINEEGIAIIPEMRGSITIDGASGLVPKPKEGDGGKFLRGDGTWASPIGSVNDVKIGETSIVNDNHEAIIPVFEGVGLIEGGAAGLVPPVAMEEKDCFLKGDGTWSEIEISEMKGATETENGKSGMVPAPTTSDREFFLRGDGTWAESGGKVKDVQVNGESVVDEDKTAIIKSYKEITQAEYDALPDSKLTDGILYCIKDEEKEKGTIKINNISYGSGGGASSLYGKEPPAADLGTEGSFYLQYSDGVIQDMYCKILDRWTPITGNAQMLELINEGIYEGGKIVVK